MEVLGVLKRLAVVGGAVSLAALTACAPMGELVPPGDVTEIAPLDSDELAATDASAESANSDIALDTPAESELTASIEAGDEEQASAAGQLLGLGLEGVGPGANVLVAEVKDAGIATLEKTASSEYVLALPETSFDKFFRIRTHCLGISCPR